MRILLIEDDLSLADGIAAAPRHAGYAVDHTGRGAEGIALAQAARPDAIVLDLGLPDMDGVEVLRSRASSASRIWWSRFSICPDHYPAQFKLADLHQLAREAIAELPGDFSAKGQSIAQAGGAAPLRGDHFSLSILLKNLLSNAKQIHS